jgi:hypothetical protein
MPRLERRAQASTTMMYLSPVFALGLTLLAGMLLFTLMGVSPGEALYAFFIEPLTTLYGVTELGVKATPLILIGVASGHGLSRQCMEYRRGRPTHPGRHLRRGRGAGVATASRHSGYCR